MPVDYVLDNTIRLVVTTPVGRVTFAEVKEYQDRLLSDPSFDPTFNQLVDTTNITQLELSAAEARAIAARRTFSPASQRAFVLAKPAVSGLGRFMQIYQEKHSAVQVFYDLDSAVMWLGLASDYRAAAP